MNDVTVLPFSYGKVVRDDVNHIVRAYIKDNLAV